MHRSLDGSYVAVVEETRTALAHSFRNRRPDTSLGPERRLRFCIIIGSAEIDEFAPPPGQLRR